MPFLRILRGMKDGIDYYGVFGEFVKYFKRKAPHQRSPKVVKNYRIQTRIALDGKNACFYATQKIFP